MRLPFKQLISVGLIILYSANNVVFGALAEANIWGERRKQAAMIQPNSIVNQLRPLTTLLPASNKWSDSNKTQSHFFSKQFSTLLDSIPLSDASVQSMFYSEQTSDAPVLLIQDVHLNAEAQTHIARLLQSLIDGRKIGWVAIEGAFEPLPLKALRDFPDKSIIANVAKSFLEHSKLGAPSYVGITSPTQPPTIVGVDDRVHYDANVKAYLDSQIEKPRVARLLQDAAVRLSDEKRTAFSNELRAFDELYERYHSGAISMGAYAEHVARMDSALDFDLERFLHAYSMEKSLDLVAVEKDRRLVLEKLTTTLSHAELQQLMDESISHRLGTLGFGMYYEHLKHLCQANGVQLSKYPAFDDYIRYALLSDGIRADKLFEAIETKEQSIFARLVRTDAEKRLARESERLLLAHKLIEFELTPREWEQYKRLKNDEWEIGSPNLFCFERFYSEADIRSTHMLKELASQKQSGPVALIVGGFHAPQIAAALKAQQRSFIIVSPKITKVDSTGGSAYLSIFAQEKTPLDKLFEGEKLFLNPVIENSNATLFRVLAIAKSLLSHSASVTEKIDERIIEADVRMEDVNNPSSAEVTLTRKEVLTDFLRTWNQKYLIPLWKRISGRRFENAVLEEIKTKEEHQLRALMEKFGPESAYGRSEEDLYHAIRAIGDKKRIKVGKSGWKGFYPETDYDSGALTGKIVSFQAIHKTGVVHPVGDFVLRTKDGRTVVQKSNRGFFEWGGGHVELGQTPEETAIMEANEELNLVNIGITLTTDRLRRIDPKSGREFFRRSEHPDSDGAPHFDEKGVYCLKSDPRWDWERNEEQVYLYVAEITDDELDAILNYFSKSKTNEVTEVRAYTIDELAQMLSADANAIPPTSTIYMFVHDQQIRSSIDEQMRAHSRDSSADDFGGRGTGNTEPRRWRMFGKLFLVSLTFNPPFFIAAGFYRSISFSSWTGLLALFALVLAVAWMAEGHREYNVLLRKGKAVGVYALAEKLSVPVMEWRDWLLRNNAPVATGVSDDATKKCAEAAEKLARDFKERCGLQIGPKAAVIVWLFIKNKNIAELSADGAPLTGHDLLEYYAYWKNHRDYRASRLAQDLVFSMERYFHSKLGWRNYLHPYAPDGTRIQPRRDYTDTYQELQYLHHVFEGWEKTGPPDLAALDVVAVEPVPAAHVTKPHPGARADFSDDDLEKVRAAVVAELGSDALDSGLSVEAAFVVALLVDRPSVIYKPDPSHPLRCTKDLLRKFFLAFSEPNGTLNSDRIKFLICDKKLSGRPEFFFLFPSVKSMYKRNRPSKRNAGARPFYNVVNQKIFNRVIAELNAQFVPYVEEQRALAQAVENARSPLEKVRAALQVLTERGVARPEHWYVEKALSTFLEVPARVFGPSGSRFARWIKETQDFSAREDPLRMFVLLQYLTHTSPDDQSLWSLECERLMRRILIETISTLDIRSWVVSVEKKWTDEGLIACRMFFEWIEEQLVEQEEVQTFVRNHEGLLCSNWRHYSHPCLKGALPKQRTAGCDSRAHRTIRVGCGDNNCQGA